MLQPNYSAIIHERLFHCYLIILTIFIQLYHFQRSLLFGYFALFIYLYRNVTIFLLPSKFFRQLQITDVV